MFALTPAAANQVRVAAAESGVEDMALRLAANRQTDGKIQYMMGFDEIKEDDIRHQSEGITIIMTPANVPLLNQTVLDFVELDSGEGRGGIPHTSDGGRQFIFLNPLDPEYVPPQHS